MEVLGAHAGQPPQGGVLNESLLVAAQEALAVPRSEARARALDFTWAHAARVFEQHLVSARSGSVTPPAAVTKSVTSLSSGR